MASVAPQRRVSLADIGGRHLEAHKLVPDTYNNNKNNNKAERNNDQRSSAHVLPEVTIGPGCPNSKPATKATIEGEEDGPDQAEDAEEDEDEEPEIKAPSRGYGKGKGKRPAIRIEPAGDDDSQSEDDETASRETGRIISKHPVNQLMNNNKKRTLSNTSLLFGDESAFPRPKVARTLSHTDGRGLLGYIPTNEESANGFDDAIESSDDEKGPQATATEDDDEDYSALNQIMDDDSDVEKLEEEEESFIIHDEIQHASSLFSTDFNARRASLDSFGSADLFDFNDFTDADATSYFASVMPDQGFGQFFEAEPSEVSETPMAKRKFSDSSAKRVRFDDEVNMSNSGSSSDSELDDNLFPDLFMEQDKLPRNIYKQLMDTEDESDDEFPSGASDQSFFEIGEKETLNNTIQNTGTYDDDDSSEAGSSGYETDMGDTTDEYDSDGESGPTPQTPQQKTILSRPASAPGSRAATPKPFQRSAPSAPGPTRGVFIHDDTRQAIAVTNRKTKKLTFYRPRAADAVPYSAYNSSSNSTANNSPRQSTQQLITDGPFVFDPFMSTDIMLTGLNGYFAGDAMGPPEAFFPFVSIQNDCNIGSDEDEYDDDLEFENDVNLNDFMDFGSEVDDEVDDETDVEQMDETDVPATPATSTVAFIGSTPAQPTPTAETPSARKRSSTDAMLERLDIAGVTAFRNNQSRFRNIASLPHDPNLRASVSRPVRSGRSADTMMSPIRKRSSTSKRQGGSAFARVKGTKNTGRPFSFATSYN